MAFNLDWARRQKGRQLDAQISIVDRGVQQRLALMQH